MFAGKYSYISSAWESGLGISISFLLLTNVFSVRLGGCVDLSLTKSLSSSCRRSYPWNLVNGMLKRCSFSVFTK